MGSTSRAPRGARRSTRPDAPTAERAPWPRTRRPAKRWRPSRPARRWSGDPTRAISPTPSIPRRRLARAGGREEDGSRRPPRAAARALDRHTARRDSVPRRAHRTGSPRGVRPPTSTRCAVRPPGSTPRGKALAALLHYEIAPHERRSRGRRGERVDDDEHPREPEQPAKLARPRPSGGPRPGRACGPAPRAIVPRTSPTSRAAGRRRPPPPGRLPMAAKPP